MATVLSLSADDHSQIQWESTSGNEITFRVTADVSMATGDKCIQSSHATSNNANFPTDIPELHIHITPDPNGSETISVSELITVTMDDIHEEVAIKLVVKEGGDVKKDKTYHEHNGNTGRPIRSTGNAS